MNSTQIMLKAISKERGIPDPLDFGILPNSQEKPHYSPVVNMVIGAVILVCMLAGVYLGVRYGR